MNTGFEGMRSMHDTGVFRREVLSNGILVWIQESPILLTLEGRLDVMLKHVGSSLDPKGHEGCAHFFEHIPFLGTEQYPDIASLTYPLERMGGFLNASTGRFQTGFRMFASDRFFDIGLPPLVDTLLHPLIRDSDVVGERNTIKEELAERFGNAVSMLKQLHISHLFAGTSLEHPILGFPATIDGMTAPTLNRFYDTYYHAGNAQIIVGGTFSTRDGILDELESAFGDWGGGEIAVVPYSVGDIVGHNRTATLESTGLVRPFQYVSYPFAIESVEMEHAFRFLAFVLGTGRDTPLLRAFRDERKWTYRTGLASFQMMHGGGVFSLECPFTDPAHFDEAVDIFRSILGELTPGYLKSRQQARQLARLGDFINPLASCSGLISDLQLHGCPENHHLFEDRCDKVTLATVSDVCDMLLNTDPFVLKVLS